MLSSNLFTHRNNFYLERSLQWNLWPPGLIYNILVSRQLSNIYRHSLTLQSFTFRSINQKYYFTVYPSLSDLTLRIAVKGLTTALSHWLQVGVCLCRYSMACRVVSYWIDTLVLKNPGKYLPYFAGTPFPLQGKTNAVLKR